MIIFFTGNGNSRLVAKELSRLLCDDNVHDLRNETLRSGFLDGEGAERVVWVMPVYSWGIPPAMKEFIRIMAPETFDRITNHYLVMTCGDDIGLAHMAWRKAIREKGWRDCSTWSVQMPNTYPLLPGFDVDSPELMQQKLDRMPERAQAIADAIKNEFWGVDDVVRGSFPALKSRVVQPLWERYDIHPKKFKVSDACISCGKCERTCPEENVTLIDGSPVWGSTCTLCLGCYNCCPVHAIDYGSRSRGKGQYFAG